jgi:SAM-dependent methyltransferase
MAIDQIYTDGRHYDRMFPGDYDAQRFWLDRAQAFGDPILELTCGTGRISIPLAQAGFDVTGLDLSEAMLKEAKRKSENSNLFINFLHGDIRHFNLNTKYSFIFLPANAICHLLTLEDFQSCMTSVRGHLDEKSRFMVEVFVIDLSMLVNASDQRDIFASYDDPDGFGEVTIYYTSKYDPTTQIKHNTTYQKLPASEKGNIGTRPMRIYFPQELDALFRYNRLKIIDKFGDMHLSPFTSDLPTQIFILGLD